MPFVTDELWTHLTGGESVMAAPGPAGAGRRGRRGARAGADLTAEAEIEALMGLVTQVRRFRSDQGLRPSQPVPASLSGVGATPLAGHEAAIRALLRLAAPGEEFAPTASVQAEGVTVQLDTAAAIDMGAERRRLEKDLSAARPTSSRPSGSSRTRRLSSGRPRQSWSRTATGWPPPRPRSPGWRSAWPRCRRPAEPPAPGTVSRPGRGDPSDLCRAWKALIVPAGFDNRSVTISIPF